MALAVTVRFDFVDQKSKPSFTKVRIPTGFSITAMTEFAQGMAQLIANISDGRLTRASICVGLSLATATLKATPDSDADIAEKGFFGFGTALAGFRTKMKLPAWNEIYTIAGSDAINQADPNVAAFLAAMEDGLAVTGGTIAPTDIRENDVTTTDYGRELFRKK